MKKLLIIFTMILFSFILVSCNEKIKVTFDYDNKTIYYLMNKYNIKYEIAKVFVKFLDGHELIMDCHANKCPGFET